MMNDYVHQNSNIKTFYHSCGCVRGFIPFFIEAGVDILNPIQTTAEKMSPSELKAEFGARLTFWGGGIDTQVTLPTGTPEQVRAKVKESVETFKPGGGFVFTPIHNMQPDIPVENAFAMLEAVKEFGVYKNNH
jgi:uroporphyrinogen decarboxylase